MRAAAIAGMLIVAFLALVAVSRPLQAASGPTPRLHLPALAKDALTARPLEGERWGGDHILMERDGPGWRVEFDCAHGTIDEPILLDPAGHFESAGTYTQEHGGPIREGEILPTFAARYTGTVSGAKMTLSIHIEDGRVLGPYELALGSGGRVFKCL